MKYFIILNICMLGLTACQHSNPVQINCDPNYAHCANESEHVVSTEIQGALSS